MALLPIESYDPQLLNPSFAKHHMPMQDKPFGKNSIVGGGANSMLETTYFSQDTMTVNYTNADGDSVSLSMEHIEYQKAMLAYSGRIGSEEWKEIVDKVKEEFLQLQEQIIKKFLDSLNGDTKEPSEEVDNETVEEIEGLPEYWNAENTSQRIVDFAVSFYGVAESSGREYYDMMRNAIEEGFNQAMGMLGELPDAVNNLANRTFELALEKLEAWATEQGIDVGEEVAEA